MSGKRYPEEFKIEAVRNDLILDFNKAITENETPASKPLFALVFRNSRKNHHAKSIHVLTVCNKST